MKLGTTMARLLPIIVLILAIGEAAGSQTIQFGSTTTGTTLTINAKPSAPINGLLDGAVITVRWLNSYGVSLGAITSPYNFGRAGTETVLDAYKYQKFYLPNPFTISWVAGGEYPLLSVSVSQTGTGSGVFELAPFGFIEDASGDPWIDVDCVELTDFTTPFYQSTTTVALPVELVSFVVTPDKQGATLTWKTATESNNSGFDVERTPIGAPDGAKKWAVIGNVKGAGTSNAPKQYVFKNQNVQPGKYAYRLKQIDRDGGFAYSQEVEAVVAVPTEFVLSQNYPNPFNPTTTINVSLAAKSTVSLKLYDITGRELKTLFDGEQEAGYYTIKVDGRSLSSGIYLYHLTATHDQIVFSQTKRLMLLK